MKPLWTALFCTAATCGYAQNEETHPYTKANISPVGFEYKDDANGGCWASAAEAPALAKAALEAAGLTYTDNPDEAVTTLYLYVDAERDGGCYGNMLLDLRGPATWAGKEVRVILRDSGANFKGHDSLNPIIPVIMNHFVGKELAGFADK